MRSVHIINVSYISYHLPENLHVDHSAFDPAFYAAIIGTHDT